MTSKTAADLKPGDGVEVPGLRGQIVKSVEPYGEPISVAVSRRMDVYGANTNPDTEAVLVTWTNGGRAVMAVDYQPLTFDPAKKAEAEARLDAAMVRIIHEALK